MKSPRIVIWGLFGQGNIGNDCTLEALLDNLHARLSEPEIFLVCSDPKETAREHDLPTIPASATYSAEPIVSAAPRGFPGKVRRFLFRRLPREINGWLSAFHALKKSQVLLMTGTGMLTDYNSGSFGRPYDIFKWCTLARIRRCKVRFVSVGVGPIYSPVSRFFFRAALSLADFCSYRDDISKKRMEEAGRDTSRDFVFPDLAFSLPQSVFSQISSQSASVIGVGVMDYRGQGGPETNGDAIYDKYLEKTCDLIAWLVHHDYGVRVLHGDVTYDRQPRLDLKKRLELRGISYGSHNIIDEEIPSTDALLKQLAGVSVVISPRFHNQLLALMLGKPVISISYDPKSDALLEGVGLGQYRQPIEELDIDKLVGQLNELQQNFRNFQPALREKIREYRTLLNKQYDLIFPF